MADRYWVGGTGTWNTSNTANWSATSGGAGGASVPTSADNVFINGSSGTGTITLGTSVPGLNIDFTGYAGTITSTGYDLDVYGSLTMASGMTWGGSTRIRFRATSGSYTFTSAGKTVVNISVFPSASTATITLADNLTAAGYIDITYGTFSTNNFSVSASSLSSSNSNTRTINLGSSTVTLTGDTAVDFTNTINLTFNAGTSTILVTSSSTPVFAGGGRTFYNVSYTGGGTQTATLGGANTFNNFSVTATTAGVRGINFSANQTINGTLSVSGTTATNRIQFGSSVPGTQRTLSVATIGTLTDTNWKDINLTGAASPWTAPLGVFDLGNNTGITFDTTTLYWVGGAGSCTDASKWSTSSGGTGGIGIPGPTNNVVFDANSGTGTVSNPCYCRDFDCSASSVTTGNTLTLNCYGSFKGKSGISNIFGGILFYGTGTHTVDPNGATQMVSGGGFQFRGTGTYTLLNNWVSYYSFNHYSGTLDTNGYSVSGNVFNCSGNLNRTLILGSSTLTFTTSTAFDFSGTNLTLNAGTSTLVCGADLNAGTGKTFYNVTFTNTSAAGASTITGANTYNNLTLSAPASAGVLRFIINANQTVNGTFTVPGLDGNRRIAVVSNDNFTQRTITAAAVSLTDVNFVKIAGAGTATWSGTRLSNGGGNSGITFDTPKTVYWNLPAGGNYIGNAWAATSGGSVATTNFPLGQDTAIIEDTGLNSGATITGVYSGTVLPNLTFATRTLPMTFNVGDNPYVAGDITLSSAVTRTGTEAMYFSGDTTLTCAGKTWTNAVRVSGVLTVGDTAVFSGGAYEVYAGGVLTLNAPMTISSTVTLTLASGSTLNLNNQTLTATSVTPQGCALNFGTGNITLTGSGITIFNASGVNTVTGAPVVNCTYSGSTGTRTVLYSPASPEANSISFNFPSGADTVTINAAAIRNLDFTGFSGTWAAGQRTIYGNLTLSSAMTLTAGTGVTYFSATSGTKTVTTNGKTLDFPVAFNGLGGTWQLADNLTLGSTRVLEATAGTFDANGKNVTAGYFKADGSNVRTITMGSGTWTLAGTGTVWNIGSTPQSNITLNCGTSNIVLSDTTTTARTFAGAGLTYYKLTIGGATGTSTTTLQANNTFNEIASTKTVAHTVTFTAGSTTTVTNFSLSGTAGNLVTIGSSSTSNFTLSKSSGIVNVSYCSISRSTATGGARWQAYTINGNVNGGNNSGWRFSAFSGNGLLFGSNF